MDQELDYHVHIHCIVSGGGLTKDGKIRKSSKNFFIHTEVLRDKFKGKYMAHLSFLYENGSILTFHQTFPCHIHPLASIWVVSNLLPIFLSKTFIFGSLQIKRAMTFLFWYNVNRQTNIYERISLLMDIILYLLQLIQQLYHPKISLLQIITLFRYSFPLCMISSP